MHVITSDFLTVNPLRLANDFMAMFTSNRHSAIANLRVDLMYMDEWQTRQWIDCLGELMVTEECPPEMWQAILEAVDSLESDVCSRAA